jgi:hypothetical protein
VKKFQVADIVVGVEKKIKLSSLFRKFVLIHSDFKPDFRIKIIKNKILDFRRGQIVFDAPYFWTIYALNGQKIILDKFNLKNNKICRIISLDKNFREGTLYVVNRVNNIGIVNPLTYPIGPVLFSYLLSINQGIFIHASAVKFKNKGFLFCGRSGAGKSTLAKLWQREEGVTILNEDRIILRKLKEKYYIYSCPWYTRPKFISNEKVPLEAIFFIRHGKKNEIKGLNQRKSFLSLLTHAYLPIWSKNGIDFNIALLKDVVKRIDCFELKFLPNKSALETIKVAITSSKHSAYRNH